MKLRFSALALPLVFGCSMAFAAPATQGNIGFKQALDIIEKAGYQNIHKIELEHNYYEVDALDSKGKKVEFNIDAMTGKIMPHTAGKHHHKHHHTHHHKHHHAKHATTAAPAAAPAADTTQSQ